VDGRDSASGYARKTLFGEHVEHACKVIKVISYQTI
jgi:hypothetical protein